MMVPAGVAPSMASLLKTKHTRNRGEMLLKMPIDRLVPKFIYLLYMLPVMLRLISF
jgi:hypothetical protein